MIEAGSVVSLKSGGPRMTVLRFTTEGCEAGWFECGVLSKANFPFEALRLIVDTVPTPEPYASVKTV